jgi:hypothetical protein
MKYEVWTKPSKPNALPVDRRTDSTSPPERTLSSNADLAGGIALANRRILLFVNSASTLSGSAGASCRSGGSAVFTEASVNPTGKSLPCRYARTRLDMNRSPRGRTHIVSGNQCPLWVYSKATLVRQGSHCANAKRCILQPPVSRAVRKKVTGEISPCCSQRHPFLGWYDKSDTWQGRTDRISDCVSRSQPRHDPHPVFRRHCKHRK